MPPAPGFVPGDFFYSRAIYQALLFTIYQATFLDPSYLC